MDKVSYGSYVIVLLLSFLCCFLLLPLSDLLSQNVVLEEQVNEYQNLLVQLENQTNELGKQEGELHEQINDLENQIKEIEEQKFLARKAAEGAIEITEVWGGEMVGGYLGGAINYYVTVHNYRTTDVDGLTLSYTFTNSETGTVSVGLIKAGGETRLLVQGGYCWTESWRPKSYTLMLNGKILDTYP